MYVGELYEIERVLGVGGFDDVPGDVVGEGLRVLGVGGVGEVAGLRLRHGGHVLVRAVHRRRRRQRHRLVAVRVLLELMK